MLINAELTETMAVTGTKHTRKIHDVTKIYFTIHCITLPNIHEISLLYITLRKIDITDLEKIYKTVYMM